MALATQLVYRNNALSILQYDTADVKRGPFPQRLAKRKGCLTGGNSLVSVTATDYTQLIQADVNRWTTFKVIPDTEGIEPGPGVQLDGLELMYANLVHRNLTGANFESSNLTGAKFGSSTLTNANFNAAVITGANFFSDEPLLGITKEQLYSTASYQDRDLRGIKLAGNDLTGWDLSGQNLTGAEFSKCFFDCWSSVLTETNLSGANLRNADLATAVDIENAVFDAATVYNQWTRFPSDFDPTASGLTFVLSPTGDFNANDVLDAEDIDLLASLTRMRWHLDSDNYFSEGEM